ncbi:NUDIX hydrolase [Actinotalea sp. K2]|nr:NUDIX hydrolase [Actinotalea sp. K2]
MRSAPSAVVHAAGALLWRERDGRLEVVLVHRPRYKDWSWPKGKLDPAESVPAAAVREVEEETGMPVVLGIPLPGRRYALADGRIKQVHYWAARATEEDDAPAMSARTPVQTAGLDEIDEVVWVGVATAEQMLTQRTDRLPLDLLRQAWDRGRLDTRPLVVVRHGRARRRSAWSRGEATRPLTPKGVSQAEALVPVLAAFGVREVLTSPWERCLRTVEPYAKRAGLVAELVDELTEAAHDEEPERAAELVNELIQRPRDAAVSTHRPVLPSVMDAVGDATRRWTAGALPGKDPYLRTGEVLVSHVSGRGTSARVVAVERHRPPSSIVRGGC